MDDFSEFLLGTLDASSLTPYMFQDTSFTGMTGINEQLNSNLNAMNSGENFSISSGAQNTTRNANEMWSDIGNTKPSAIDDDDPIFKNKTFDPTLAQLNTESLHEDLNVGDWTFDPESYLKSISLPKHLQQTQSLNHINTPKESIIKPQLYNHQPQLVLPNSAQEVLHAEKNKTGSSSPYEMYHSTPTRSFNSRAAFTPARQASTRSPVVDIIDLTTPPRDSNPSKDQQDEASDSGGTKTPFLRKLPKLTQIRNIQHNLLPGPSTSHILMNSKINSGSTSRPSSSGPTEFRLGTQGKKERYFLQHNVQAKGLQGQRLVNPRIPLLIADSSLGGVPAFNPSVARKDTIPHLTPNSGKLNNFGNVGKMPRKEKKIINCRVYPVRQTEHNEVTEINLHGLDMERRRLLSGINNIKQTIVQRSQNPTDNTVETRQEIGKIFETSGKLQIAGETTALVKKVLESHEAGVPNEDLDDLMNST